MSYPKPDKKAGDPGHPPYLIDTRCLMPAANIIAASHEADRPWISQQDGKVIESPGILVHKKRTVTASNNWIHMQPIHVSHTAHARNNVAWLLPVSDYLGRNKGRLHFLLHFLRCLGRFGQILRHGCHRITHIRAARRSGTG